MLTKETLKKYILAIDKERASSTEKVLPFYKYGYGLSETNIRELSIHTGYRNTLERYIKDNTILTEKEILCILRLYSIDFPDLVPILPPEILNVVFVPSPMVQLDVDSIVTVLDLTFVPQPQVTLAVNEIPVTIDFVPKPQVSLDIETVGLTLQFIPTPIVKVDNANITTLTSIPKPIVNLDISTIPPEETTLDFVPMPYIFIQPTVSTVLDFVPKPIVKLDMTTVTTGVYYWGYVNEAKSSLDRQQVVNTLLTKPAILQTMINSTDFPADGRLQVGQIGTTNVNALPANNWSGGMTSTWFQTWNVFLTPVSIPERVTITTPTGTIVVDPEFPNVGVVSIDGVNYNLHVISARTRMNGNYILNS